MKTITEEEHYWRMAYQSDDLIREIDEMESRLVVIKVQLKNRRDEWERLAQLAKLENRRDE